MGIQDDFANNFLVVKNMIEATRSGIGYDA